MKIRSNAASLAAGIIIGATIFAGGSALAAYVEGIGEVSISDHKIYLAGEQLDITGYNIDGNNYFKIRDLGEALDIAVDWDAAERAVTIDPAKPYSAEPGGGDVTGPESTSPIFDYMVESVEALIGRAPSPRADGTYPEPVAIIPDPEKVDYRGVVLENSETGDELYLGMSASEIEDVLGAPPVERMRVYYENGIMINLYEGRASMLGFVTSAETPWNLNGLGNGSTVEDVIAKLGEPDSLFPAKSITVGDGRAEVPKTNIMYYLFKADGTRYDGGEEYAYILTFSYEDDNLIASIGVTTVETYMNPRINLNDLGAVLVREQGRGNATLLNKNDQPASYNITHKGSGDFVITQNGTQIFKRTGEYEGRVYIRDLMRGEFQIETEGEWSIKHELQLNRPRSNVYSGSSDMVLDSVFFSDPQEMRVTYNGEGPITITAIYRNNPFPFEENVWLESPGSTETTIDLGELEPMKRLISHLEIVADGEWTIEIIDKVR